MPANTVYVGRPSKWGNPFHVVRGPAVWWVTVPGGQMWFSSRSAAQDEAIDAYRRTLPHFDLDVAELAGRDLACWCPLDQPCHADVLLHLAAMAHDMEAHP